MPFEMSLRKFEPMDDGGAHVLRKNAAAREDQNAVFEADLDACGVNPGQGDENDHLAKGFENVDGRLPDRKPRTGARRAKHHTTQTFGAIQHREGVGPHPGSRKIRIQHLT